MDGLNQVTLNNNTSGSGSAGASTATGGTSTSSDTSPVLAISSDAGILHVGFLHAIFYVWN